LFAIVLCTSAVSALGCSSSSSSEGAPAVRAEVPPPPQDEPGAPGTEAPAAAPPPATSAPGGEVDSGKRGLLCTREEDLGGGRRACVTKIGDVEVRVLVAAGGSGAMRLGLYLHGDGAAAYQSNGALKAMINWADTHHGIAVAALAPNGCSWWQSPEFGCTDDTVRDSDGENAPALVAALTAIFTAYDIRQDGIRYYGASGGSIFLTDEWIPLQGGNYPGVFALMCGGETSSRTFGWDAADTSLVTRNGLWFTYGDQDSLFPYIKESIAAFREKSFPVTEKIIPGAGHCEFDAHAEAVAIWSAHP
jgi:pimeloyl-ACP methyl ester carboxylesterase